jgi:hypothetical protein
MSAKGTLMLKLAINADQPMTLTVTLSNEGEEAVLVNGRLAFNAPYAPEPFRELSLAITGADGAEAPFMARINIGFPGDDDFVTLDPGQGIDREIELDSFYELESGEYTVLASYENQSDPAGDQAWKGTLSSKPGTLKID